MFSNKSVLMTGSTGSSGRVLTKTTLEKWQDVKRLVIYPKDAQKQSVKSLRIVIVEHVEPTFQP